MNFKNVCTVFICFFCFVEIIAQEHEKDSLRTISKNIEKIYYDCEVVQGQRKLKGRRFASVPPLYLRANDTGLVYSVFQLGKRGRQIFLYINILDNAVCLKQNENIDVFFSSGEVMTLKNDFPVNCEGVFARRLRSKELNKIIYKEVVKIRIYSYQKDYEFYIDSFQDGQLGRHIRCLQEYKYR